MHLDEKLVTRNARPSLGLWFVANSQATIFAQAKSFITVSFLPASINGSRRFIYRFVTLIVISLCHGFKIPAHLGVTARWLSCRFEQSKEMIATPVAKSAGPFLYRPNDSSPTGVLCCDPGLVQFVVRL